MQPDDDLQANIDRTVGYSAVRRMSKLAEEINDQESRAWRSGHRLLVAAAVLLLVLLVVALVEPGLIAALLRWATGGTGV